VDEKRKKGRGLVTPYDIRPGNKVGWKSKKIDKASKKGKRKR